MKYTSLGIPILQHWKLITAGALGLAIGNPSTRSAGVAATRWAAVNVAYPILKGHGVALANVGKVPATYALAAVGGYSLGTSGLLIVGIGHDISSDGPDWTPRLMSLAAHPMEMGSAVLAIPKNLFTVAKSFF